MNNFYLAMQGRGGPMMTPVYQQPGFGQPMMVSISLT